MFVWRGPIQIAENRLKSELQADLRVSLILQNQVAPAIATQQLRTAVCECVWGGPGRPSAIMSANAGSRRQGAWDDSGGHTPARVAGDTQVIDRLRDENAELRAELAELKTTTGEKD